MLTVGGLFDGIGLLAYGLHLAGLRHAWLCEVDEWRRGILVKRFPGVPIFDDVRAVGAHNAVRPDVVAGGFPCKGASDAGKREGFGHPETVLWHEDGPRRARASTALCRRGERGSHPSAPRRRPCGEPFSGTWPRSGTTRSGIVFPQQPSAPLTSVTGSSPLLRTPTSAPWNQDGAGGENQAQIERLLPTPTTQDGANVEAPSQAERNSPPLNALVRLLPTPKARDGDVRGHARGAGSVERGGGMSTEQALKLLPTPDAQLATGYMSGTNRDRWRPTLSTLAKEVLPDAEWALIGGRTRPASDGGKGSTGLRLSPWFVEWVLGAPQGWSDPDCPLSATEFRCRSASSSAPTSSSERPSA